MGIINFWPEKNSNDFSRIFRPSRVPAIFRKSDFYLNSLKLGHRPGGYGNAVEDYWPWLGWSLMQAHPYLSWLSNIKALNLVKAVAGLEK